jgi:hypothetical protein
MSKITAFLLVLCPLVTNAQWTPSGSNIFNSNTGNVGIGTTTPSSKLDLQGLNVTLGMYKAKFTGGESASKGFLHIKADAIDQTIFSFSSLNRFGDTSEDGIFAVAQPIGNTTSWNVVESWRGAGLLVSASGPDLKPLLFGIDRVEKARLHSNGNFGIGTPTPAFKLDVNGIVNATALYVNGVPFSGGSSQWTTSGTNINFNSGNVGIGTTLVNNPNSYKLAVNGKIGAKEVQVEITSTTWPDYVFEKDYSLLSLEDLKAYIEINKHLPEIPSAKEIEINGLQLGEMNKLLLKKVEELTLHILKQDERIKLLEERKN